MGNYLDKKDCVLVNSKDMKHIITMFDIVYNVFNNKIDICMDNIEDKNNGSYIVFDCEFNEDDIINESMTFNEVRTIIKHIL